MVDGRESSIDNGNYVTMLGSFVMFQLEWNRICVIESAPRVPRNMNFFKDNFCIFFVSLMFGETNQVSSLIKTLAEELRSRKSRDRSFLG